MKTWRQEVQEILSTGKQLFWYETKRFGNRTELWKYQCTDWRNKVLLKTFYGSSPTRQADQYIKELVRNRDFEISNPLVSSDVIYQHLDS